MRMWGDKIDSLHVAAGTIFNEVIELFLLLFNTIRASYCIANILSLTLNKLCVFVVQRKRSMAVLVWPGLFSSLSMALERCNGMEEYDKKQIFTIQIPNSKRTALLDRYLNCQLSRIGLYFILYLLYWHLDYIVHFILYLEIHIRLLNQNVCFIYWTNVLTSYCVCVCFLLEGHEVVNRGTTLY